MTRSKEAIRRRAAKRGVDEAEQRIRDNPAAATGTKKQKGNDGEAVSVQAPVKTSGSVVNSPAVKKAVTDDWICTKCNNKNFATRSDCNRCGDCRSVTSSSAAPVPTAQPASINIRPMRERPTSTTSWDPRDVGYKTKNHSDLQSSSSSASSSSSSSSGTKEGTWKCLQCTNNNFPSRNDCNRCGATKPSSTASTTVSSTALSSSSSSSSSVDGQGALTTTKSIPKPNEQKKIVADGKAKTSSSASTASNVIIKTKWAKQASPEEVANNQRLREVAARLLATQGKSEEGLAERSSEPLLTEAEMARAKVLLERSQRKKEKKENMKKWKEKKQLIKTKQQQSLQKTTKDSPASATKHSPKSTTTTPTKSPISSTIVKKETDKQTMKSKPKQPTETAAATASQ